MVWKDANRSVTIALIVVGVVLLSNPLYATTAVSATADYKVVEYDDLSPEAQQNVDETLDPDGGYAPEVSWEGGSEVDAMFEDPHNQWTLLEPYDDQTFRPAIAHEIDGLIPESTDEINELDDVYIEYDGTYYEIKFGFVPCLGYRMSLEPTSEVDHIQTIQSGLTGFGVLFTLGALLYNVNLGGLRNRLNE